MSAPVAPRVGRRPRRAKHASLGATSLESVNRFVRILARCGGRPHEIVAAVRAACGSIPKSWGGKARAAMPEMADAAHVLTLWFTEPEYLDAQGEPAPLPLAGGARSLAALIRRVDARLHPHEVLRYLRRIGAVRMRGARYVPRSRGVLLRGANGPDYFRTLRVLANMLRTLEHNVLPARSAPSWFEYFAENPRFPVSARAALATRVNRIGQEMLVGLDAYMRRREIKRKSGEPTVRVGIGLHLWEDAGEAPAAPRRRRPKRVADHPVRQTRRR